MADSGGAKVRTVADVMSHPPVTATPSETIAEATSRMREHRVGSVVVVDGERAIGILTERDLVRFAASGADTSATKVSEWMTEDPDCVAPDIEVTEAWKSLAEHGYRHIPVVDGQRLVGIVSMRDLVKIAQIRPVEGAIADVPKGLAGVVVAETEVGDVRGQEGFYHYRQYNAVELAEKRTLEDVWFLLYYGHLPSKDELKKFIEEKRQYREVPEKVKALLPGIANAGDHFIPLDALRTAVSLVAYAQDYKPSLDIDAKELRHNALQITSVIPTLIMSLYRLNKGQEPIDPNPDLPYSANYLYMLTGEVPDPENARAVEQYQISTIDHGFNASTFTARVITSTGADLGAAVVGAIGALSGPLHGGAPSRALDMLDAIGKPENAEPWVRDAVEHGKRIMGFGHRVYKTEDPRSRMLKGVAERLGGENVEFAKHIEQTVVDVLAELKPG
ncbi:MAG: CBS domain-containing protein, partial [Actinobacteria bacterium]|nr:CBS domain-containing protein [Actinomycetota bacterium]